MVATVRQHGADGPAVFLNGKTPDKRRRKARQSSVRSWKDRDRQDSETSQMPAMPKSVAGLRTKRNLRDKRPDPSRPVKRRQKRRLPRRKWQRRGIAERKRVFPWSASRRPQSPVEAGLEASLEIQRPQGAGRPCYEADNSACRGEWRREAGSRSAPNASPGKRDWRRCAT